jgi:hypothetical protein
MIEISSRMRAVVFRVNLMLYLLTKLDQATKDAQYAARRPLRIGLALVTMVRLAGSICTVLIPSDPACLPISS